jgi:hypothetical protein
MLREREHHQWCETELPDRQLVGFGFILGWVNTVLKRLSVMK